MPDFKQEKAQKFTTIILTLGASIILGIFAINPTLSTITNLQKQIEDDKFIDQQLQEKINNLSVLQQKYSNLKPDLPIVYDAVPQSPQIPLLLGQIQAVAKDSNITLGNFLSSQVQISQMSTLGKKYNSYDFNLSAQGNYQDLTGFLEKLVNFQRIVNLTTIYVSKGNSSQAENTNILQLNIKGTVYFKQ